MITMTQVEKIYFSAVLMKKFLNLSEKKIQAEISIRKNSEKLNEKLIQNSFKKIKIEKIYNQLAANRNQMNSSLIIHEDEIADAIFASIFRNHPLFINVATENIEKLINYYFMQEKVTLH